MGFLLRHLLSALIMGGGVMGVLGIMYVMNSTHVAEEKQEDEKGTIFEPPPKKKKKQTREKPKPKPKPKKVARRSAPAPPAISGDIGNTALNMPGIGGIHIGASTEELLADTKKAQDMVMSANAVDTKPRPVRRVSAQYPSTARARGVEGKVVFRLTIGPDGSIDKVRIVSSEPPGVFDEVATAAIQQWQFSPGMYNGEPQTTQVTLPFVFKLM